MSKDFNDFIEFVNKRDWSSIEKDLTKDIKAMDVTRAVHLDKLVKDIFEKSLQASLTIVKDYHEWLNK